MDWNENTFTVNLNGLFISWHLVLFIVRIYPFQKELVANRHYDGASQNAYKTKDSAVVLVFSFR
jgi:hypothetical protein